MIITLKKLNRKSASRTTILSSPFSKFSDLPRPLPSEARGVSPNYDFVDL